MVQKLYKKSISAFVLVFMLTTMHAWGQTDSARIAHVVSFSGSGNTTNNELSWATTYENNCSSFTIERSCDHIAWEDAGKIKAEGNTTKQIPYYWKDESPYTGFTYYRLKAIAADGHFAYTPSIVVECKVQVSVEISPNPANGIIKINVLGTENESSHVYIKNMMGQILFSTDVVNNHPVELDIEAYPEGVYAVDVESKNGSAIQKLIKR
ncbi:MAG TPA: T9SS type A sorting domain-containing protein [Bacteroidia bacterium]|jgi:hypothetical protein|nr:T9SS type A sorting domain-containing protein [Bacteroidia bacterium]